MILVRLTDAIRTQNWVAIALEFLLVLSSVVLGFQITAWNEARQDRQEAGRLIVRIAEELDQSLQLVEREIPDNRAVINATLAAHNMLVAGQVNEANRAEFQSNFLSASWMSEVRVHKSALEVFQNSDAASVATSAELRLAIARYYEFILIEREQELLLLSDFLTLSRDLFDQFDVDSDYFSTTHIRGDISAMNDNQALIRTVLLINLRQQVQLGRLENIREEIITLREQIRAELGAGS